MVSGFARMIPFCWFNVSNNLLANVFYECQLHKSLHMQVILPWKNQTFYLRILKSTMNLLCSQTLLRPKGGLSGRMTWQLLNVLELFSPWKIKYPIFAFVQSLFSTKKSPKVVNLALTDEKLCLNFWRHKQAKWLLQFSKLSLGSYASL